jgi:Trypsin
VSQGAKKYALTNAHVLDRPIHTSPKYGAPTVNDANGKPKRGARHVISPAGFNGGTIKDVIGFTARSLFGNGIDAALVGLCSKSKSAYGVGTMGPATGPAPECVAHVTCTNTFADGSSVTGFVASSTLKEGDIVWKYGAMTGKTQGTIAKLGASVPVPVPGTGHKQTSTFTNQIFIDPVANDINGNGKFQDAGDSGAALMKGDKVVGLLHGMRQGGGGIATPIETVLNALQVTVDTVGASGPIQAPQG